MKYIIIIMIILLSSLVYSQPFTAESGTITKMNIVVRQTITPLQCYNMGHECIENLLCKVTNCYMEDDNLFIEWIW